MDLASQDAELRAALFRFVDVVPACRSLDDLARHLTGFLDEVGDRPPPLQVAMRMSESKAGRPALGAAAAAGVKHMAHRFIVGETPREATGVLEELWRNGVATTVDLLGEATVTTARGRPLRGALRARRSTGSSTSTASCPSAPALEADSAGRIPRENLSVKVSALTPLLRPDAPELGKRDAAVAPARAAAPRARARRAPAHRHGVLRLARGGHRPRARAAHRGRVPRRPVRRDSCCRPTCATAPSCASGSSTWAQATPRG